MRTSLAPVLAALLASSFATVAPAAEPVTKPAPRKLLSRPELRACMLRKAELQERDKALKQAGAEHVAAGAVLSEEATLLSEVLRTLDTSDEAAVNSYNRRNEARNLQVEVNNKRANELNAAVAELQSAAADLMAECTARPFLKADEEALLKELGKDGKAREPEPVKPKPRPTGKNDA